MIVPATSPIAVLAMIPRRRAASRISCFALLLGCSSDSRTGGPDNGVNVPVAGDASGDGDETSDGGGEESTGTDDSGASGIKFDLAGWPDGLDTDFCTAPTSKPCDDASDDPWHAMGINCPGSGSLTAEYSGDPSALYVHTGPLGSSDPPAFPAREGEKITILSTGYAQELTMGGIYASTDLPDNDPLVLPSPIMTNPIIWGDCITYPGLVGMGDCSNTINGQWSQGTGAYDYAELRISGSVPMAASGFTYDFAFFSSEYPSYYKSSYNDMYIAWLQSDLWTGNVSFDDMGNPISLNASFLDYKDAPNPIDCPEPCEAPELQGTAMEFHAGTKWLTTTAGVFPGEEFTLIFAIFDVSDGVRDSAVILDNFEWNCEGGPPVTIPG